MKDSFAACSNLSWQFLSRLEIHRSIPFLLFKARNFKVSIEKAAFIPFIGS
jgi:hypothetical protein